MMALGAAGGMAVPFALGQLAEKTSLAEAMVLLLVVLAALAGLLLLAGIRRRTRSV